MKQGQVIPMAKILQAIRDLGYTFSSQKEENYFIRKRCQIQQTEYKGTPVTKFYIDRVEVAMFSN